jgi:competence protein ComEC
VLGAATLALTAAAAPGRRRVDPLGRAGLVDAEHPSVAAVAAATPDRRRRPLPAIVMLAVGVSLCGVAWAGLSAARVDGALLYRLAPRTVTLIGTLREDPEASAFGWHALVDVSRVGWSGGDAAVRETTWVSGNDAMPDGVRGDQVQVEGTLQIPDDPDFASSLAHRGLGVSVRVFDVRRLGGSPSPFIRMTQVVRAFVGHTIERIFPPREAGLLLGLVLGDASKLDPVTTRDFQTTGLGHLLVVSGENVAMVLAPAMAFAAALRLGAVTRFAVGIGVVALFVVLTGAEPSVLRAGAMAFLALFGIVLGKPRSTGSILAAAVLVLLVLDPWLVHAIGFQLSVAATAGMWLPLGNAVALVARLPMRYLEAVASILAKAPVAWITSSGSPLVLIVGVAVSIGIAWWLRTGWHPPRRLVVAAVACAPLLVWQAAVGAGPPGGLTVRVLDIGQGDSILITSPAGATVLVDGGPDDELAAQLLVSLGVKRLDAVVATHPHADHIAGLPQVLARFPVGVFLEPGCPDDTELQAELHDEIDAEGIPVRTPHAGDVVQVGDLTFRVLSPDRCWTGSHSDPNNDSIVMLLEDGPDSMLFTGDAEREAQQVLLDTGALTDVDVLKMPHHGGDTSLPELFPAVSPEIIPISVGQPNPYEHPDPTALAEAGATGAAIWRTDEHGTLTITWDARGDPVVSGER